MVSQMLPQPRRVDGGLSAVLLGHRTDGVAPGQLEREQGGPLFPDTGTEEASEKPPV